MVKKKFISIDSLLKEIISASIISVIGVVPPTEYFNNENKIVDKSLNIIIQKNEMTDNNLFISHSSHRSHSSHSSHYSHRSSYHI